MPSYEFGSCSNCGADMQAVWYIGINDNGDKFKDIDYLVCPICLRRGIVDDSFSRVIERGRKYRDE